MLRSTVLFIVQAFVSVAVAQTPICAIQGTGSASPYDGQAVTTTGIVTVIFSGSGTLQGFFIEDPGCDADATTSNGLFIYDPNTSGFAVGDRLSVSGTVQEFQTLTELYSITNITVIGAGSVVPTDVAFPLSSAGYIERFEGMLVRVPGTMTVTDNDDWAHYGELIMSPERLWQPTHTTDPNDADPDGITVGGLGNVAAVNAQEVENVLSSIILDDGLTGSWPDPPPLIGAEGTLRCGSTVNNLSGVLHYMYSNYRLHPAAPIPLVHSPRPDVPDVGGDLRIVSWNVHNYWSSLGGFGAANSGELARQRTKLTTAMEAMDADALVLCEMQNNDEAWPDLLAALNALYGTNVYSAVEANEGFGTKTVIFYKTAVLSPATPLFSLYTATFERAHVTQGFEVITNGTRFLLSGVHLRSKLCDNATGANQDLGDGQGCFNARRIDQAVELAFHWQDLRATTGIGAQLIMGDFNAYLQEDPIDMLRYQQLVDLVPHDAVDYSYRYANVFGAIDHAFGAGAMVNAVTGARLWAINADEPPVFDYPDANIAFYQPDPYRSSDHDPVVVGIEIDVLTGIADVTDPVVLFTYDVQQSIARWAGEGIVRIDLVDALGRNVLTLANGSSSANLSAIAPGTYSWRCVRQGERAPESGRFVKW